VSRNDHYQTAVCVVTSWQTRLTQSITGPCGPCELQAARMIHTHSAPPCSLAAFCHAAEQSTSYESPSRWLHTHTQTHTRTHRHTRSHRHINTEHLQRQDVKTQTQHTSNIKMQKCRSVETNRQPAQSTTQNSIEQL